MSMTKNQHPDREYAGLLHNIAFRPVFIMGDHRTGTTILYKLLEVTQCFNIVTAYHIIRYKEIIYNHIHQTTAHYKEQLAALFDQKGLRDRGIDGIQASPDMPEEYGFILRNAGYRPQLKPDNVDDLVELCKKIQLTSDPSRMILLKNPWDYFLNFVYVKKAFPESKFVFIHRNPINTINSQLRATRSLLSNRNEYVALVAGWYDQIFHQPLRLQSARLLFSAWFNLGLKITTRHVALATDYFLRHVSLLPQKDYICLRYEDLCAEPEAAIAKVLDFLGLASKPALDYKSFVDMRGPPLLNEVAGNRAAIFKRMQPYFEYCGYTVEGGSLL